MFVCRGCCNKKNIWKFGISLALSFGSCEKCGGRGECINEKSEQKELK